MDEPRLESAQGQLARDPFRRKYVDEMTRLRGLAARGGQETIAARALQRRGAQSQTALARQGGGGGAAMREGSQAAARSYIESGEVADIAIDAAKAGYSRIESGAAAFLAMKDAEKERLIGQMKSEIAQKVALHEVEEDAATMGAVGTGMGYGATTGGTIGGTFFGPPGALVGAGVGAVVGGTIGWLSSFLEEGGTIPGPDDAGDVVPAMLSPGEVVIPKGLSDELRAVINKSAAIGNGPRVYAEEGGTVSDYMPGDPIMENILRRKEVEEQAIREALPRLSSPLPVHEKLAPLAKTILTPNTDTVRALVDSAGEIVRNRFPDNQNVPYDETGGRDPNAQDRAPQPEDDEPGFNLPWATGGFRSSAGARSQYAKAEKAARQGLKGAETARDTELKKLDEYYHGKDSNLWGEGEIGKEQELQNDLNMQQYALDEAIDKLQNFEINPNRAFPNLFSKLAAVISVALGGYAEGLSGGKIKNRALEIVNKAIDTDINAQKVEYYKLKGMVDTSRNLVAKGMESLKNMKDAERFAKAAAWSSFANQADQEMRSLNISKAALSTAIQGLGLDNQAALAKANLLNERSKIMAEMLMGDKAGVPEMDKGMKEVIGAAAPMFQGVKDLGELNKKINYFTAKFSGFAPWETQAEEFDRKMEMDLINMVYLLSGKAVTKAEFDRFKEFIPTSNNLEETRTAKLLGFAMFAAKRGAGLFKMQSRQAQEFMRQRVPRLVKIWEAKNPAAREAAVAEAVGLKGDADSWKSARKFAADPSGGF